MDEVFLLIGVDTAGNMNGPIAKRKFSYYDEAVEHARNVLNSGGNPNLTQIYIMTSVAVAQRTSPPVEVIPVLRHSKAA